MRSRYSAFVQNDMDYVERTTHPKSRSEFDRKSSGEWASQSEWLGLEIVSTSRGQPADQDGQVEFVALYRVGERTVRHHEMSHFAKHDGIWYFVDGKTVQKPVVNTAPKVGRNDPCSCGSGQKYKKCCGARPATSGRV